MRKLAPVMCDRCFIVRPAGIASCPACGDRCEHNWVELTRLPLRYEAGVVFGTQRCDKCGSTSTYQKEEDE